MVVATPERTLSGLGRAMMQWVVLPVRDAEALQSQAKTARMGCVEQRPLGQTPLETAIDEFAVTTFCPTLRCLAALDAGRMSFGMTNGNGIDTAGKAQRESIRDLLQSGLLKVRQGVTSLQEVDACTNK
ncbi:MAG: hypothetical protein ACT4PQ_13110 [Betaproteobacteria bacterium]